ncbi:MAG: single-stranded-DNA-specific exonuclease RecJ [Ignavibacteria bacterium]|nr:single-stranded-DNA-specific exonuclease RecJ [Ignavibacteria bacterium]
MKKNWKLKELTPRTSVCGENGSIDDEELNSLRNELRSLKANFDLPDFILRLLHLRNIVSPDAVRKFFYSSTEHKKSNLDELYDPFLMKGCESACQRIVTAIESNEKIMILGDYDVDGTCGVSLFSMFLKEFGMNPEVYIPDRISEGYGISIEAIDHAESLGIKLIVSIDCGITACDKVAYAKQKSIEFIICDHHQPPDKIPDALAVIDVHRKDDEYPCKDLCGTGVAFKLATAVSQRMGKPEAAFKYLDLVAVATASDIVPIVDENRILVKEGLKMLNTSPRNSFAQLLELSGLKDKPVTTGNIVFTLAPRINAVGRMGDAKRAVQLLTCEDSDTITEFAKVLQVVNEERRDVDKNITDDAFRMFEESDEYENGNSIVIYNKDWHPGVVGIVAARLVEKYNLPSIVLTEVNGYAKGSARSINSFNIYDALKQCNDSLRQFGGHFYAAGLELELGKIDEFKKQFNEVAAKGLTVEQLEPVIDVDCEIKLSQLNDKVIKILNYFEPYGPENLAPVFVTRDLKIVGEVRRARADTHIFRVWDPESGKFFECVFFNSAAYSEDIVSGKYCDICYSVDRNFWNNREYMKLRIRDMRSFLPS